MAIDYLTDVEPLEAQGLTDAEIAALLAASTLSDIPVGELENYLTFQGLAVRNPLTGAWEGPLPDEITNNVYGLGDGLAALFSHVNKPRSVVIDTTVSPWATDAANLTAGLVAAGLLSSQQRDDFYNLGSGRPNANVVEADVVAARQAYQSQQAEVARQDSIRTLQAEIENTYINPAIADGVSDEATVRAAIKAGL